MNELALAFCIAVVWLGVGLGILKSIHVAFACRRAKATSSTRRAIFAFGAAMLVLGVVCATTEISVVAVAILLGGGLKAPRDEHVISLVVVGLLLSLAPIGGALLLSVGRLLNRERAPNEMATLYGRLDGLRMIAWVWIVVGTLVACVATIGGIPLFVLALVAVVLGMRRSAQRDGLVWVLAIAAQKKLSLAPAVEEYADQCRGTYQPRVLQLAERLSGGMSLPDALDADPRLVPPPVRVAARVGLDSGVLGESLRDAAVASLHRPAWHAALGRLLLLLLPLLVLQAVGGFILYFIAPKFSRIFADFGLQLPEITKLVYSIGQDFLDPLALLVTLVIELAIGFCLLAAFRGGGWWIGGYLPLDRLFRGLDRSVVLRALAVSVDAGRPLVAGLESLAACYPKMWVRSRLEGVLHQISLGFAWSDSLHGQGIIRRTDAALLDSAQRVGNLAWAMRELADRSERRLGYLLQLFTQLLFPVVLVGVGAVFFLFAVGYFSPLVKLITEMSG